MTDDQYEIIGQINVALETLGAPIELLCLVGSFGQSQEDCDVLEMIKQYNECGAYMQDIFAVNDVVAKDFINNEPIVKH